MLLRKFVYSHMTSKQLYKRIDRLAAEMKVETDIKKKFKLLDDIIDIINVTIRKNRNSKPFMDYVQNSVNEMRNESNVNLEGSRN